MAHLTRLLDRDHRQIATAVVEQSGTVATGTVDLHRMPPDVRALFERFEIAVNDQVLSLVDEFEDEIANLGLTADFGDGSPVPLSDVQLFPQASRVSFRIPIAAAL